MTVDELVHALMHPGTAPPQEDVLESRVLDRSGSTLRVYIKLVRSAVVTVTYDTEHTMTFRRESDTLTTSRSVATRIAEVGGGDRGFLWRLNSYWTYRQVAEGVIVELDSVSLSRSVPAALRPVAGPIINRIARESLVRTLDALRRARGGSDGLGRVLSDPARGGRGGFKDPPTQSEGWSPEPEVALRRPPERRGGRPRGRLIPACRCGCRRCRPGWRCRGPRAS